MKKDIHPQLNKTCVVTCACGNKFETLSVKDSISVDVCSMCHPFFTKTEKLVDAEGRVDKFYKKLEIIKQKQVASKKS